MGSGPYRGRRLRKGRRSEPGRAYLVTTVTRNRIPWFAELPESRAGIRCLHAPDVAERAQTLAFVLMPDHLHWLLRLTGHGELSETVRRYKARVAIQLGASVWQKGFHDRAIRRETDLRQAARYLVANPLRAGLVDRIGDYPHWDAIWLDEKGGWTNNRAHPP